MAIGKDAFWHALIFTIFIFASGLFIGSLIENSRVSSAERAIYNSEINLLDQQIRSRVINDLNVSCSAAKEELFSFADEVYLEALKMEDFDNANKFADVLPILHKRYDLLRVMIWLESQQLETKCKDDFRRVVYLYTYSSEDPSIVGVQSFYARLLGDLKNELEEEVLLIPIAVNTNVSSVDLALRKYNVSTFPSILIDEKILLTEPPTLEELREIIVDNNN